MAIRTSPWDDKEILGKKTFTFRIQDTIELFVGSYAAGNPVTGRATLNADTATFVNLGLVVEFDSPLQSGGSATGNAAGTVKAIIDIEGGIIAQLPVAGAAAETDVFDEVSLATDNAETDLKTAANVNTPAVGIIIDFQSATSFTILFFTQETMLGL